MTVHFADLVSATNTTNVNIPQMADTLFERATNASWVVVFKALVTTHHMCVHGNEVSECDVDLPYLQQILFKARLYSPFVQQY